MKELKTYRNRKQFMTAVGATGMNDAWNWSYVNHKEKFVVFGLDALNNNENGKVILNEDWRVTDKGHVANGYTQALKHIELIEQESYLLKTFPIVLSDLNFRLYGEGPAIIESFTPELTAKLLKKVGKDWVALPTEESAKTTAEIAESMMGEKLYQQRARAAMPILVRQAVAGEPIYYEDLAAELRMPNPRNLNYVLGSIGQTLIDLAKHWNEDNGIPPIQCIVVSKKDRLPGEGIGWFIENMKQYKAMSLAEQHLLVDSKLVEIYQYLRWGEVLEFLDLAPSETPSLKAKKGAGYGGEGLQHKALKKLVSSCPAVVKLPKSQANGEIEYYLPSGDSVDVMFEGNAGLTAVEVKSVVSNDADIERGLFQCVKYQAVTEALLKVNGAPINVRTILVLGGEFPKALLSLKNMLGVEVIDRLQL